jgi:hypothetical protein
MCVLREAKVRSQSRKRAKLRLSLRRGFLALACSGFSTVKYRNTIQHIQDTHG